MQYKRIPQSRRRKFGRDLAKGRLIEQLLADNPTMTRHEASSRAGQMLAARRKRRRGRK